MKTTLYPIYITLNSLSEIIAEHNITENDTIYLNQVDFDELALEYREKYGDSIEIPFYHDGVMICEQYSTQAGTVKFDRFSSLPQSQRKNNNTYY